MLIKNIFKNSEKNHDLGIHNFITKLKTKIDVIPRSCFNKYFWNKLLYNIKTMNICKLTDT